MLIDWAWIATWKYRQIGYGGATKNVDRLVMGRNVEI